jgi:hypothetical protein
MPVMDRRYLVIARLIWKRHKDRWLARLRPFFMLPQRPENDGR